jgi:hypothetical protein
LQGWLVKGKVCSNETLRLKAFGIKVTIGGCSAMINLEIIPLKIFGQVLNSVSCFD